MPVDTYIRAVVFDFDDTLLATFESRVPCLIEAAEYFGHKLSKEQIKQFWGLPFGDLISALLPTVDYIAFYDHYKKVMSRHMPKVHLGAREILEFLHTMNVHVAVVSSSSNHLVKQDLEACKLLELVDFIQGFEETQYHKPDGRVLLPTLHHITSMGISLKQCVSIGDSIRDYMAAKANNILFFAVLTGDNSREDFLKCSLTSPFIVDSLLDLLRAESYFRTHLRKH